MKKLILIICVALTFACNKSDNSAKKLSVETPVPVENPKTVISPKNLPTKMEIINIPSLANKSEKEIVSVLGEPIEKTKLNKADKTGDVSFDYGINGNRLDLRFKGGKAVYFHFTASEQKETYFELGEIVGLDLKQIVGLDLKSVKSFSSNPAQTIWQDASLNNILFNKITVNASDSGYSIITAEIK